MTYNDTKFQFAIIDAQAHTFASHGSGSGLIHISNVRCSGNELSLFDCPYTIHFYCHHYEDASVTCQTLSSTKFKQYMINKL